MLNATLLEQQQVTENLFIIKVKPSFDIPDFTPGQYATLGLPEDDTDPEKPKLARRAYSIVSPPTEKEYVEFYYALVPDGELTPKLNQLPIGSPLFVAPRFIGTFTATDLKPGGNLILIATGTAIGPYVCMLRDGRILESAASITVIHGVRYSPDLAYRDELQSFADKHENVNYYCTISRPDDKWSGDTGYVGQYLRNETMDIDSENTHVFLCGNPEMIKENNLYLTERGYSVNTRKNPDGRLYLEKYW